MSLDQIDLDSRVPLKTQLCHSAQNVNKKIRVLGKPVIESLSKLERDVQMLRLPSSFHSVDSSIASNISSLEASLVALLSSGASCPSRGSVRSFLEP